MSRVKEIYAYGCLVVIHHRASCPAYVSSVCVMTWPAAQKLMIAHLIAQLSLGFSSSYMVSHFDILCYAVYINLL